MAKGHSQFTIVGTANLANQLKKKANISDIENVVRQSGADMQQSAVRYSPYDTGFLARSIELQMSGDNMIARVFPTAEYAVYQEYGTRYQSGTPFIRPAFYRQQAIFLRDLSRYINKGR